MNCSLKVSIVGCGRVGVTAAFTMLLDGTPTDIVLFDRHKEKALGEKLDLEHALPFLDYVNITGTDDYADLAGSRLIVYTAGAAQAPGETRLDLCAKNLAILKESLPKIVQAAPEAVILIVANPVDVLTYHASQLLGTNNQIFGSGTMLDTARFRYHLSETLHVNAKSIHAYVLGEHGDTSFPVYHHATVGGIRLLDFPGMNESVINQAYDLTKKAAYNIIQAKGATYYAIGVVIKTMMEAIFSDAKTIFPLSVPLHDYYGHSDVALSVPCVLGGKGIASILHIALSEREQESLKKSVETLKQFS